MLQFYRGTLFPTSTSVDKDGTEIYVEAHREQFLQMANVEIDANKKLVRRTNDSGDSGRPLIWNNTHSKIVRAVLIGTVVGGRAVDQYKAMNLGVYVLHANFFANIARHLDWINDVLSDTYSDSQSIDSLLMIRSKEPFKAKLN